MISASLSLDESIECIYNLYEAKVATFIIQNHNKKKKTQQLFEDINYP